MKWPFTSASSPTSDIAIFWQPLAQDSDLDAIALASQQQPVALFKHSTRCSISRMALRQFEAGWPSLAPMAAYYLDLLNHRDISNAIAARWGVQHQSPQVLVVFKDKVIHHASHEGIDVTQVLRLSEML